jgi:pimeloyl-ACP methyl ester carboxylesterase
MHSSTLTQASLIDDIDIHIEGDGSETIIMIHGWPDTHELWDAQVDVLKDKYKCIRFTLPSFDLAGPRRTHTIDEITALIKSIIERHCPNNKAVLLLHDWGCLFGYEFSNKYPDMVSKMIGVDIGDPESMKENASFTDWCMFVFYQMTLVLAWLLGRLGGDWLTRMMAKALGCPTPSEHIWANMNYPYFMFWFGGSQAYRKRLNSFNPQCPFLFIYGTQKPLMFHHQAWADDLGAQNANKTIGLKCGHWVMVDQVEEFNNAVVDWLAFQGQ